MSTRAPLGAPVLEHLALSIAATKTWAIKENLIEGLTASTAADLLAGPPDDEPTTVEDTSTPNEVSVVGLRGILTPQPSLLAMLFGGGGGGLNRFVSDLRAAVESDTAAVIIDVDSPGGLVDQVPETAARVRDICDQADKPVVAIANTQCCSAAYWLASQTHEIVITSSGEAGAIGVYTMHVDESEQNRKDGLKYTLISAGKYKTEGNPFEPISEEALKAEQRNVDYFYGLFIDDVALGRDVEPDTVRDAYGQGRALNPDDAKQARLVDRIATFSDTVTRLVGEQKLKQAEPPAPRPMSHQDRLRLLEVLVRAGYNQEVPAP
jgi:capsid assembly protease